MAACVPRAEATVRSAAARRRALIDPLLPERIEAPAGCEAGFTAIDRDGEPIATGSCEHWTGKAGSLDLAWGARRRFRLIPHIAGPDVAGALSQLIDQWREHLATVPEADGPDTSAIIDWPSRDIDGIMPMLEHGLVPLTLVAARLTDRHPSIDNANAARIAADGEGKASGSAISIRRAEPTDIDAIAGLGLLEIRYDAHFGGVIERPGAEESFRRYAATLLTEPEPWTWVAERDGVAVGALVAERPQAAAWIAPLTALSPVAYLMLMVVRPELRGNGIGATLTQRFHREVAAAGVRVTLVHFELLNPLSMPFWSLQGYRPMWTTLEAKPALGLR